MAKLRLAASLLAISTVWACGACGQERLSEARRQCRTDMGQAYHLAPNISGKSLRPAAVCEKLDLRVHLPLRASGELDGLLAELYDPNSSKYGKFLTPQEFAARFHPTQAHFDAMRAHLSKAGFHVSRGKRGAALHASGDVRAAHRAFGARIRYWEHPTQADHRAPDGPLMAEGLPEVRAVRGLATPPTYRTQLKPKASALPLMTGFSASDIRTGYQLPPNLTGAGEVIGFVELDGYLESDLDAYAAANKLRRVPTRRVAIQRYDGQVTDPDAQVEVTMDIQLANALAPDAKEFRVFSAKNSGHGLIDILNEIANPTTDDKLLVKYISNSWGVPEEEMTAGDVLAEADLLKQMAAQGQAFFSASGDNGSRDDGSHIGVDDPAAQPWATAVGGTTLRLNATRQRMSEVAWTGSGGGVSCFWPSPSWQTVKLGQPAIDNWRNVPDIAMHADPGGPSGSYIVIVNGQQMSVGGTSCAAPLWTAIAAGIGSQRAAAKKGPLGSYAPHLYRLGAAVGNGAYNQIDQGGNGDFFATPDHAYDNVCGWGSPRGAAFIKAFVGL